MGFTIEELIDAILHSSLEEKEKTALLAQIFKTGKLNKDMFLTKADGDDTLLCIYKGQNEQGEADSYVMDVTAEEAVSQVIISRMAAK